MPSKVENFFQLPPFPDSFGGQQIDPKYQTCHRMTTFYKRLLLRNRNSSAPSERYPSLSEFFIWKIFPKNIKCSLENNFFAIFSLDFFSIFSGYFFSAFLQSEIIKREHHNDIFYFPKFSFFRVTDFVSKLFFRSVDRFVSKRSLWF